MTGKEYQKKALRTVRTDDEKSLLTECALGLSGECGECVDHIKKHLFQGHTIDKEHLAKEIGDCVWYLAVMAHSIGYDLDTIFLMNVEKLEKRYPNGFETEKSVNREEYANAEN